MAKPFKGMYKWIKWEGWEIYEGTSGIAVGSKNSGYSVFASKTKLNIKKNMHLSFKDESGYFGRFETKRQAAKAVRQIDKALNAGPENPTTVVLSESAEGFSAFSMCDPDTGGALIVYAQDHPEDQAHEDSHYLRGHLRKKVGKDRQKRKSMRTGLKHEKEAIETEIRLLKLRGLYSAKIRQRIKEHFSSYFNNKTEKGRLSEAEKFIKSIEKLG